VSETPWFIIILNDSATAKVFALVRINTIVLTTPTSIFMDINAGFVTVRTAALSHERPPICPSFYGKLYRFKVYKCEYI
jgi:hypothetical protein